MVKCKTLNDITYKDLWRKVGTTIDIDEKDVDKLESIGAVVRLEAKPEAKVKINVIKNPIKVEKLDKKETKEFIKNEIIPRVEKVYTKDEDIELPPETAEKIYKENKSIKRKYNRRSKSFKNRRF